MSDSRWTLLLVPHDNDRVRTFQLTARRVRAVVSSALLAVLMIGTFATVFLVRQSQHFRTSAVQQENELLAAEVDRMRGEMETLNAQIDQLAQRDEKFRVIAGLPELDPEVQRVGIGGPDGPSPARAALARLNPAVGGEVGETSEDLETLLRRARLLRTSMDEALTALERNNERLAATPSIAPSAGHLTSLFSNARRHPVLRITRPHRGIDIAAPVGTPILAPAAGRVVFAGNRANGYGNMVEIDHGFGYVTRFAHASRLMVRAGQQVRRGDTIAAVGATGLVSGPHLHYEVEVDGRQVDPMNFIIGEELPE